MFIFVKQIGGAAEKQGARLNKMPITEIEIYKLLQKTFKPEEAEKIVTFINEQNRKAMEEAKEKFLTQKDKTELLSKIDGAKIELLSRMDFHFKAMVGILLTTIGIAITLIKIL